MKGGEGQGERRGRAECREGEGRVKGRGGQGERRGRGRAG